MTMVSVDIQLLHETFELRDGQLFWRSGQREKPWLKGKRAGTVMLTGYRVISVGKKRILEHRAIFAMVNDYWPSRGIDHIDRDKSNNRPENLREATHAQNCQNRTLDSKNTSGVKGVWWHKGAKKWLAVIHVNRKKISLGFHEDLALAKFIYECAVRKYHGEFAPNRTGELL
jgi:hypothetical protein